MTNSSDNNILAKTLLAASLWSGMALVTLTAWNYGIRSMFPRTLPWMNFNTALAFPVLVYTFNRVVAAAWAHETEQLIANLFEAVIAGLNKASSAAPQQPPSSDHNNLKN